MTQTTQDMLAQKIDTKRAEAWANVDTLPLRVARLSEACRPFVWADRAGNRWFYGEEGWCRETPFLERPMRCYDEVEVVQMYPCAGPFTRITGVDG